MTWGHLFAALGMRYCIVGRAASGGAGGAELNVRSIFTIYSLAIVWLPAVPELFPRNKSVALSLYNCAIYLGRALSFGAALAAGRRGPVGPSAGDTAGALLRGAGLSPADAATSIIYVPLDNLDLRLVSIVYTRGDYAAVMPNFRYTTITESPADVEGAVQVGAAPGLHVSCGRFGRSEQLHMFCSSATALAEALVDTAGVK
jgi:hypothetical protein